MGVNLGPDHDLAKRLTTLEAAVKALSTRDVLQNAAIGAGGLVVNGGEIRVVGGGSLIIADGGTLSVPDGSIDTGGNLVVGGSITAGSTITATGADFGTGPLKAGATNVGAVIAASVTAAGTVSAGSVTTTGGVSATGGMSAGGGVSAGGAVSGTTGTFNSGLYSTDARNFVVVNNYAASWIDINGHLGTSPSTERYKKDIAPWVEDDPERVFDVIPVVYRLRIPDRIVPLVDESGDPVLDDDGEPLHRLIPGFEEADDAKLRPGFIAERLVEAGFEEVVVFDEDGLPVSINYAEWVVPLQMAVRYLRNLVGQQTAQLEELGRRVVLLES